MPETFPGAKEALEQLRPTLLDIPANDVGAQRFNTPQAVSNLLKIAGAFSEDRPYFELTFKKDAFDPERYEDLDLRARALWQADVEWRQRVEADKELPALLAEGGPLEKKLFRAADYLWGEDPDLGPQIAAIRSGRGHLDLADDLMALANLFDSRWQTIAGKTHVTEADIARARGIGAAVAAAYGGRTTDKNAQALRDLRQRAFHYAESAAREIRDAAAYVHRARPERLEAYPSPFRFQSAKRTPKKSDDREEPTPQPAHASAEA